jgi:parallel beta-helix repeat protein
VKSSSRQHSIDSAGLGCRVRLPAVSVSVSFVLFLLIVGALIVNSASANFIPEQAPTGIVITADGSVEGTDLIRYENGAYFFTGDVQRTIVVLRDNIVIDGAGHSLQGGGSGVGFFLQGRRDVEIRNVTVSNFEIGVKFTWLYYGSPPVPAKDVLSGNMFSNNTYGVVLSDSSSCVVLRNNQFLGNKYCLSDNIAGANDVDASNTVNGKRICYWVSEHDRTVPLGAGFVVLKNCSGVTVQNLNLSGNLQGILLYYTTGSTIAGNVLANNFDGVTLKQSAGNTISGNHIANNKEHGVLLDFDSGNNIVSNNRIESNGVDGISIGYYSSSTPGNTVTQNEITGNGGNGVSIFNEQDSTVANNNITLNGGCGIRLGYGTTNVTVRRNYMAKNGLGIQVESPVEQLAGDGGGIAYATNATTTLVTVIPKGSTIVENVVAENNGWGIRLNNSQGGNVIYHNNFVNNNVSEGLQVSIPAIWNFSLNDFKNPPTMTPGKANVWDNGKEGNYWSDYTSRYPNASEVGNTGVGDTPFYINENNIDHFPLTKPIVLPDISILPPPVSALDNNSTAPNHEDKNHPGTAMPNEQILVIAIAGIVGAVAVSIIAVRHKKLKPKR